MTARVYYEDTDAAGVVYYANYLRFAERARTEFLRYLGFDHTTLLEKEDTGFVVRKLEAEYLAPARLDDLLTVDTRITERNPASVAMEQTIGCNGKALFRATVWLVCVSRAFKPKRIPAGLFEQSKGE